MWPFPLDVPGSLEVSSTFYCEKEHPTDQPNWLGGSVRYQPGALGGEGEGKGKEQRVCPPTQLAHLFLPM
jgi:hypothetical protein